MDDSRSPLSVAARLHWLGHWSRTWFFLAMFKFLNSFAILIHLFIHLYIHSCNTVYEYLPLNKTLVYGTHTFCGHQTENLFMVSLYHKSILSILKNRWKFKLISLGNFSTADYHTCCTGCDKNSQPVDGDWAYYELQL